MADSPSQRNHPLQDVAVDLTSLDQPPDAFVFWMAGQLDIPAAAFAEYARRPQTTTDHARQLAATLGLRPPTMADVMPRWRSAV